MPAASSELIAAIKASLANPAHAWDVSSASENEIVEPEPDGEVLNVTNRIVSLESAYLGAQLVFMARLAPTFVSAQVMLNGTALTTSDSDLYDAIADLADAHATSRDEALIELFTPVAGTLFPLSIASTVAFGEPAVG